MKFGTIGTSWITDTFIDAANEADNFKLAAVYSRTEDKAKQFAEKHDAPHYFTDLRKMAASNELDCVYISSPNSLHFEQAVLFLKHKKHVICEKPIFSNTTELQEAHRIAEENEVYLFEAMRNIHSPNFLRLQENMKEIGTVRSMMLQRVQYSSRYDKYLAGEVPNIFSAEFSGGAIVDLGVYPLTIAVALFGKPQRVAYFPVKLESGVDGNGTLVLVYPDFTCTIVCSKISNSYNPNEIHGEKGTLLFGDTGTLTDQALIKTHSDEKVLLETVVNDHDMVYEINHFRKIIETANDREYKALKELSYLVLSITEEARKQSGIVFAVER
ncbi:Gfo/Idh/MocA family protein [Virgibacillus sp. FSP13]